MNDTTEQLSMSSKDLYREENFTDQKIGSIRRLTPVDADGNDDSSRDVQFFGQTQVLTPAGPLPINFEMDVTTLSEATEAFAEGAEQALEKTMQEMQEMRRQQQSSIVVPGQGGPGGAPGGGLQMP